MEITKSLVDDYSKSERIEVGCGSWGSPERMGIFDKPTVMPRTQCLRPMPMAKPRPGQTQGKPFMQSLSLAKSECVQTMDQCENLAATASSSELPAAWDCSSAETCYWHLLNPPSCPSVHQTHTSCIRMCKRNELSFQAAGTSPHSDHSPPHHSFPIPVSVYPSFLPSLSPQLTQSLSNEGHGSGGRISG